MKKFIAWLVLSSKDPQKVSLTIKGFLVSATSYILFFTGILHLNITGTDINTLGEALAKIAESILVVVSSITTFVGIYRKIKTTLTGTNKVINTGTTL